MGTYQGALQEQYKLCVEMAERVSSRRNLTNSFFLTPNTAVVAAFTAVSGANWRSCTVWMLLASVTILLTQCLAWFVMMRSDRQLNAAKYAVIGAGAKTAGVRVHERGVGRAGRRQRLAANCWSKQTH